MKIIDCNWEIDNIGKKTVEFEIEGNEKSIKQEVLEAEKNYEYLVAKVFKGGNIQLSDELQELGFKYIESQIKISKKAKDFNYDDRLVKLLGNKVMIKLATCDEDLDLIINSMTENMFSTDRIYLDREFGPEIGLNRYRNWVKTEYQRHSLLYEISLKDGTRIGFGLSKIVDGVAHGLLGGIYEKFQNEGYGLLTAISLFLYKQQSSIDFKREETALSSNNMPMMQFYNYLNFKIDDIISVYIKHC